MVPVKLTRDLRFQKEHSSSRRNVTPSDRWEWDVLREEVKEHGVETRCCWPQCQLLQRLDLEITNASNPTRPTSTREGIVGEFIIVNKHLLRDLVKLDIWSDELKNKLMAANGSVQE